MPNRVSKPSEHSADTSKKGLTLPNTRSSVAGSGFKVAALVTMTQEAYAKVRAVSDLVSSIVLAKTYIKIGKAFRMTLRTLGC